MITNKQGMIEYVNPSFEKTTGYQFDEVVGQTPKFLKSGHHGKDYYERLWSTLLEGKVFRAITTNKNKNGGIYIADQTITPIKDEWGNITHFVSIWKDISERVKNEDLLKALKENLEIEKYKLEEILAFDEKLNRINNVNKLADFIVQNVCCILKSKRCSLMLYDDERGQLFIKASQGLREDIMKKVQVSLGEGVAGYVALKGKPLLIKDAGTAESFLNHRAGTYQTPSFMSIPMVIGDKLLGVVNVTERVKDDENTYNELDLKIFSVLVRQAAIAIENAFVMNELKYLTITDPLTKLFNYRYFLNSLDQEISRSQRFKRPLSLLMLDVDNFKSYNDAFGHLEGDALLKGIAQILRGSLREVDILCRYAGDEFAIILPETDKEGAQKTSQRILDAIKQREFKKEVRLSIGVAIYYSGMNRQNFIRKADSALYEAKHQGKACACVYG